MKKLLLFLIIVCSFSVPVYGGCCQFIDICFDGVTYIECQGCICRNKDPAKCDCSNPAECKYPLIPNINKENYVNWYSKSCSEVPACTGPVCCEHDDNTWHVHPTTLDCVMSRFTATGIEYPIPSEHCPQGGTAPELSVYGSVLAIIIIAGIIGLFIKNKKS